MASSTIWKNYIYNYVKDNRINKFYDTFFEVFEKKWEKLLQDYDFDDFCQLKNGNRLRPMLVYWGFLLNKDDDDIFAHNSVELDKVIDYCVGIEVIHKISLLIDDMIDNDVARHGHATFHTIYGEDTTVLLAVNLLLKSIMQLNTNIHNNPTYGLADVHILLETAYKMTKGALLEVTHPKNQNISIDKTKKIIELETSTIIKNSLVIGYSIGHDENLKVINSLNDIGYCCGYIFQALNDIEPYGNSDELEKHKGSISIDITNNRKNIVYAYLVNVASSSDLDLIEKNLANDPDNLLLKTLIEKYSIINLILDEIEILKSRIELNIDEINKISNAPNWCNHFNKFISLLINVSKKRALGND